MKTMEVSCPYCNYDMKVGYKSISSSQKGHKFIRCKGCSKEVIIVWYTTIETRMWEQPAPIRG